MAFTIRPDGIWDEKGLRPNPLNGKPYSKQYTALSLGLKGWSSYDIWKDKKTIIKQIHQNSILLVILPTGQGKTVIAPKLLLHYFGYKERILVTTPRHTTTSEAGSYAAQCLDVPLYEVDDFGQYIKNPDAKGKEPYYPTGSKIVGYKYSGNTKHADSTTMLLFATDGVIKQHIIGSKIGGDRDLSQYAGIVIDEAHERSVNIDILIALVMDIIPRRPTFKIIIMSATINERDFTDYFKRIGQGGNYATYKIDENNKPSLYAIKIEPELKKIDKNNIVNIVYNKINAILLDKTLSTKGDILAFVTSEAETEKVKRLIDRNILNYDNNNKPYSIKFTANVDAFIKDIATNKNTLKSIPYNQDAPDGYSRKVIIATNAVESSVTFKDPLVYVIDTGLAFEKTYDAVNYCYQTGKNYVSQASIMQRCGRTGRNCDGYCKQLYTTEQFDKLDKFSKPKILVEEFTKELLSLTIVYGNIPNVWKFLTKMIVEPYRYRDNIERGYDNLLNMALIDASGNVSNLGIVCNSFRKFDIKIAKMIVASNYFGCMQWCIMLGAILSNLESFEKIFKKPANMDENPKLEQIYNNTIKNLVDNHGDHITLLKIFSNYIDIPYNERHKYADDNGLDSYSLNSIQKDYMELLSIVKSQINNIKNLNLFDIPNEAVTYGGNRNNTSIPNTTLFGGFLDTENFDDWGLLNNNKSSGSKYEHEHESSDSDSSDSDSSDSESSIFDFDDDYINYSGGFVFSDSESESESESDSDSDSESESESSTYLKTKYNNIKTNNIKTNNINNSNINNSNINKTSKYNYVTNRNYKGGFQDNISNNKLYGTINQNAGSTIGKNIITPNNSRRQSTRHSTRQSARQSARQSENKTAIKTAIKTALKTINKQSRQVTRKKLDRNGHQHKQHTRHKHHTHHKQHTQHKHHIKIYDKHKQDSYKQDSNKETANALINKKRIKTMDLLNFKNIGVRKLTLSNSLENCILSSLLYGYSNNIASYTGKGKDYNVKYSPLKGTIIGSSYDFSNNTKAPDFIIYNEFSINKDMGREGTKLSIVSSIGAEHIKHFFNINDIREQILQVNM